MTALVDDRSMLPALKSFREWLEVTEDGDLVYVFPVFMKTGAQSRSATVEIPGSRGVSNVSKAEDKLTRCVCPVDHAPW